MHLIYGSEIRLGISWQVILEVKMSFGSFNLSFRSNHAEAIEIFNDLKHIKVESGRF